MARQPFEGFQTLVPGGQLTPTVRRHVADLNAQFLELGQLFSTCVACNGNLQKIREKAEVKDSVPEYVFLHYDLFRKCEKCGKIYWEGTHPRKFREDVGGILGVVDNSPLNK